MLLKKYKNLKKKKIKAIKLINNFKFNSIKNFKKLFYFISFLKKRKSKILLIGNDEINIFLNLLFVTGNKKIKKFKNIFIYSNKWSPGLITTKNKFLKIIQKEEIKLIIYISLNEIEKKKLNEFYLLNLPIIFFNKNEINLYNNNNLLYPIVFKNGNSNIIFIIYLLKFLL